MMKEQETREENGRRKRNRRKEKRNGGVGEKGRLTHTRNPEVDCERMEDEVREWEKEKKNEKKKEE